MRMLGMSSTGMEFSLGNSLATGGAEKERKLKRIMPWAFDQ